MQLQRFIPFDAGPSTRKPRTTQSSVTIFMPKMIPYVFGYPERVRTIQSHLLNIFFNSTVKPDPPQNVTIESQTFRTITISWKSGFDGNSEITSYTVEIGDNGVNFSYANCQGWPNNSCKILGFYTNATNEGLRPNTTYFIRVFADNNVSRSDASSVVKTVTDEEGTSLF